MLFFTFHRSGNECQEKGLNVCLDCTGLSGLHVQLYLEELKQVIKQSDFVLTFLGTCPQDGRSGVQGVSKGCHRSAPEDPSVAPAVLNVCPQGR